MCPYPENSVAVNPETHDKVAAECADCLRVVKGELKAVKPRETIFRADPEVSVGRLGYRRNGVLGQPRLCLPVAMNILRESQRGVKASAQRNTESHSPKERKCRGAHMATGPLEKRASFGRRWA